MPRPHIAPTCLPTWDGAHTEQCPIYCECPCHVARAVDDCVNYGITVNLLPVQVERYLAGRRIMGRPESIPNTARLL